MKVYLYHNGIFIRSEPCTAEFIHTLADTFKTSFGIPLDAEQIIEDINDECVPVVDHPTNGMRFEFARGELL